MSQHIDTPARDFMEARGWRWGPSVMRTPAPTLNAIVAGHAYQRTVMARNAGYTRAWRLRAAHRTSGTETSAHVQAHG